MKIVGVKFDNEDRVNYFYVEDLEIKKGQAVIADDGGNLRFGLIVTEIHTVDNKKLNNELGKIIRIATEDDCQRNLNNINQACQALNKCRELIKKYNLEMNVIDTIYTFDQDQLLFHFYAESRVDFRNLARELASIYKTRIELRQIGVRDKAKRVCGMGLCGQKLCCSRFLNDFDSVSISMAKNQNLSLNPTKINGVCGRLLCCLKYENECYKECRNNLPNIGQTVEVDGLNGRVISTDILKEKFKVETTKGIIEVDKDGKI